MKEYFKNFRTAIPFGKFNYGNDDEYPENESFIGREGARAKLINFLNNTGIRGAILVTGRRGMGKTRFVEYCLREYQDSYYARYLRSSLIRNIISLVWLAVIAILIIAVFTLGSRLLENLILILQSKQERNGVLIIPTVILTIGLAYPILVAEKTICSIINTLSIPGGKAISISIIIFTIALSRYPHKIAQYAYSNAPVIIGLIILSIYTTCQIEKITHLIGKTPFKRTRSSTNTLSRCLEWPYLRVILVIAIAISLTIYCIYDNYLNLKNLLALFILGAVVRLALLIIISKIAIQSSNEKRTDSTSSTTESTSVTNHDESIRAKRNEDEQSKTSPRRSAIIKAEIWTLFITATGTICATYNPIDNPTITVFLNFLFLIAAIAIFGLIPFIIIANLIPESKLELIFEHIKKPVLTKFYIRIKPILLPLILLLSKSVLLLIFGTQLLSPLLSLWLDLPRKQSDEVFILLYAIVALIVYWIEYELIIRPSAWGRQDNAMRTGKRPDYFDDININHSKKISGKRILRKLEKQTLFYSLCHFHLHSIICTINLGFEKLDHYSVIHGMLLSVRNQYYRKFLSPTSPRVIIRYTFTGLLIMAIVTELSEGWFHENPTFAQLSTKTTNNKSNNFFDCCKFSVNECLSEVSCNTPKDSKIFIVTELTSKSYQENNKHKNSTIENQNANDSSDDYCNNNFVPSAPKSLCEMFPEKGKFLIAGLYFEKIKIPLLIRDLSFFHYFFDINRPYYLDIDNDISFRIYHIALFLLVYTLLKRINRAFSLIPYANIFEKLTDLIDSLTTTSTTSKNKDLPKLVNWVTSINGFHENKSIQRTSLDPRIVELAFMEVLEELVFSKSLSAQLMASESNAPSIEITFVFDELDKLATKTDALSKPDQKQTNKSFDDPYSNDIELYRLGLMKDLLSDMKRIITASAARYIFVGGRLLHDDWLADGARRQPLLTSIFSDEIYLPSLLNDPSLHWWSAGESIVNGFWNCSYPLTARIHEYFLYQYQIAQSRNEKSMAHTWAPIIALKERQTEPRGFIQDSVPSVKLEDVKIIDCSDGAKLDGAEWYTSRTRSFIYFLTYRSNGNPKRLNELLASFIVSTDRHIPYDRRGIGSDLDCQDILYFPDAKVYRIQLIARIFRQLRNGFEHKLKGRDDKAITSLIYLSDFIIKFHNRAFSWESLELIDEITHLHRGHDLRSLLHDLVEHYSDRYLHRIINGMYTYRFHSYFANEIEYLSRQSEEEMAAFNFTLDESQTLRANLLSQLENQKDNQTNTDILSMLGELHECYQEYAKSREYYQRCVDKWDELLTTIAGTNLLDAEGNQKPTILSIYTNTSSGHEALISLLQWGPQKLRMLMKIAMTYELVKNYDEALLRYRQCMKFSEVMLKAFSNPSSRSYARLIDHLDILFEPLFAYVWLLEKYANTNNTSSYVLEEGLKNFENILSNAIDKTDLAFIRSLWQKKTGAFYFYKGFSTFEINDKHKDHIDIGYEYYMKSAYNLSTYTNTEARDFTKFDIQFVESLINNPFSSDINLAIAESLGDISEALLAKIDIEKLFTDYTENTPDRSFHNEEYNNYLENRIKNTLKITDKYFKEGKLHYKYLRRILNNKCESAKLEIILNISFCSSIYLLRSGYVEAAAREATRIAEVIAQLLKIYWFRQITTPDKVSSKSDFPLFVLNVCCQTNAFIAYVTWLMRTIRGRSSINQSDKYLMGHLIPVSALTAVCSICMGLTFFIQFDFLYYYKSKIQLALESLQENAKKWLGHEIHNTDNSYWWWRDNSHQWWKTELKHSILRHRYPVLNQLNAIKTLLDYEVVSTHLNINNNQCSTINTNWNEIVCYAEELYLVNEKYSHALHFTPMQLGHSFYLVWHMELRLNELEKTGNFIIDNRAKVEAFELRAETRLALIKSLEMCHMGRAHFVEIDRLHYLYDDFNDNQIHRNHAMQMVARHLTRDALKELREACLNDPFYQG
ncbi:hypothetical protein A1507_14410 [Methylomonas koyamae]|uniref:Uncharacterized protein n=1 Tax=Methylomonas koyamae TaxID=702114 RepID=A0A177NEA8_9GAMM|nr:ATP-binding protein [Methylomonas koyamae]OAI15390.1 hypothetical protein A1507_14410 [Methylomonas koyamae]